MSGVSPVTVTVSDRLATLRRHVDVERLADVDHDPLVLHLAEALELRGDVVDTDGQRRQPVDAFGVARLRPGQTGLRCSWR